MIVIDHRKDSTSVEQMTIGALFRAVEIMPDGVQRTEFMNALEQRLLDEKKALEERRNNLVHNLEDNRDLQSINYARLVQLSAYRKRYEDYRRNHA